MFKYMTVFEIVVWKTLVVSFCLKVLCRCDVFSMELRIYARPSLLGFLNVRCIMDVSNTDCNAPICLSVCLSSCLCLISAVTVQYT